LGELEGKRKKAHLARWLWVGFA